MLDSLDKSIIAALHSEMPLTEEPFQIIAERLGISQQLLLCRLAYYRSTGKLRKLGAVLRHRKVGFSDNALCAWVVPEDQLDRAGEIMAAEPRISHCYARAAYPEWPYTLYTMLHGHSRAECEAIARRLSEASGIVEYILLFTAKEWKKTSMRYFVEETKYS